MEAGNGRLLVIGAGVNGSICAAQLHQAGFATTLLARGERFAFLRENGVVIEDPIENVRTVTRVPLIDHLDPDDVYDFILVVVRKNQVADLLPVLASNKSPNVVFMVNNALGPEAYARGIGAERVMLGFVFGIGKRDGEIIRATRESGLTAPFGELDGSITARLTRLLAVFKKAGLKAKAEQNMADWQVTHAALAACLAAITIKNGADTRALAKATEDLRDVVTALREALLVLRALGHRIVPGGLVLVDLLPRFVFVLALRLALPSRFAEVGIAWHCQQAPDEMAELARELKGKVEKSGLPVPTLRKVLAYVG